MFRKNKTDQIDYEKVNDSVFLLNKILKILFFAIVVVCILLGTYIIREWKILKLFKSVIDVLTPFFIGFFIAWLFNPMVTKLSTKMKRGYATAIVYLFFLIILALIIFYCIPTIISQLNDFGKVIPSLKGTISDLVDDGYKLLSPVINLDLETLRNDLYEIIMNFGQDISVDLPSKLLSIITSVASGLGTFLIGLVIGAYMLLDFDGISKHLLSFFPANPRKHIQDLMTIANDTLIRFIQGTLLISLILTIVTYIAFLILGIKAPLLFAIFVGFTNIIPYIGPYIGGIPVVLVGFSQSFTVGILTIVVVVAAQALDGYILRPILLGKGLNLHPVTIIISLLLFGHFFGILGMILSMPVVATLKLIYNYYDEQYDFFNRRINEKEIEKERKE